jgi:hypothetical protein
MLDGKTVFEVPNVPETAVLVRFNALFAYLYDAVTNAKGMVNLRIDIARNQTIASVMNETFPEIKCFACEKLPVINPKLVAYIHALIIDCVSIPMDEHINARALQHEVSMWVYSKMKPDSFRSQFQAVLTTYYEDIKQVQGASGCTKAKSMKRRFQDANEDGDDASATAAPAAAAAPAAEAAEAVAAAVDDAAATPPDDEQSLTQEEAAPAAPARSPAQKPTKGRGRGKQG